MPSKTLNITMAQINLMVGDINNNTKKIIECINTVELENITDVIIFPELSISSYPPEDLLFRPAFNERVTLALDEIVTATNKIYVIIGYPIKEDNELYNACSLINEGKIIKTYYKQYLPNYGVFDEKRYFTAGNKTCLFNINGITAALSICEDIWVSNPIDDAAKAGANIMFNINASPYHKNKLIKREKMVSKRAKDSNMHIVYTNLVGGQDELVFDGNSMIVNNQGEIIFHAPQFEEGLYKVEVNLSQAGNISNLLAPGSQNAEEENIYNALVLGVKDYVRKNNFKGALIGLSGGIDSALTLSIAVDALGAENVEVLIMPSRFTADMSNEDAVLQAKLLGVNYEIISIEQPFESFLEILSTRFKDLPVDITEENIQARCRGILLMAASNKSGKLVLTTGNKSEMAVGYATLYGDMCGGYAPLKDVWKTLVYKLAIYRNKKNKVIPERVILRPPSAELRYDQVDQDSLPDYDTLDVILEQYIEFDTSPKQIIKNGFDAETVFRVIRLVDINEYKRRQAAPGVRITERAFGRDRRYPITSNYVEK